jgi:TFIIH basal transcription factor complex TTD-A subunit
MLLEVDPAIKAIILEIDRNEHNEYVIEDLDETHLLVKENKMTQLKQKLDNVYLTFTAW